MCSVRVRSLGVEHCVQTNPVHKNDCDHLIFLSCHLANNKKSVECNQQKRNNQQIQPTVNAAHRALAGLLMRPIAHGSRYHYYDYPSLTRLVKRRGKYSSTSRARHLFFQFPRPLNAAPTLLLAWADAGYLGKPPGSSLLHALS